MAHPAYQRHSTANTVSGGKNANMHGLIHKCSMGTRNNMENLPSYSCKNAHTFTIGISPVWFGTFMLVFHLSMHIQCILCCCYYKYTFTYHCRTLAIVILFVKRRTARNRRRHHQMWTDTDSHNIYYLVLPWRSATEAGPDFPPKMMLSSIP